MCVSAAPRGEGGEAALPEAGQERGRDVVAGGDQNWVQEEQHLIALLHRRLAVVVFLYHSLLSLKD